MGPVERAIRATYHAPVTLYTVSQRKPFKISVIDHRGIVLLLGQQESPSRLPWEWLESIPVLLARHPGWMRVGGAFSVEGEPGTLDELLKGCVKTDVARWLAVVLRGAGLVELSERPLRVRLPEG
jgi:hypothetical protein